eukprot:1575943-Alexandrium_andersonii.AAC.1
MLNTAPGGRNAKHPPDIGELPGLQGPGFRRGEYDSPGAVQWNMFGAPQGPQRRKGGGSRG